MAGRTTHRSRNRIQRLSKKQTRELLDRRAKRILGISGDEFLRRFESGELKHTPAESALSVLAEIVR